MMFGSSATGTGPLDFRIVIQEATGVPKDFHQLRVLWQKGVQEISTDLSPVRDSRAEWNATLQIQCTTFRGSDGSLKAKQCWLQILSGPHKNSIIGYAQLDLAELSDGRAHTRSVRVRCSDPDPTKASTMQSMKLTIHVEAAAQAMPVHSSPDVGIPTSPMLDQPVLGKDLSDVLLNELVRNRAHSSTFSPSGTYEPTSPIVLTRGSSFKSPPESLSSTESPRNGSAQLGAFQATLRSQGSLTPVSSHPLGSYTRSRLGSLLEREGSTSCRSSITNPPPMSTRASSFDQRMFASLDDDVDVGEIMSENEPGNATSDLRGRLLNLVWSECAGSGLQWQEQEDAVWLLAGDLSKQIRQQQSLSCGLVFSSLPGAESRFSVASNLENIPRRRSSWSESWRCDARDLRQVPSQRTDKTCILYPSPRKLDAPEVPTGVPDPLGEHSMFQEEHRRMMMEQQQLLSGIRLQIMALLPKDPLEIDQKNPWKLPSETRDRSLAGSDIDQTLQVVSAELPLTQQTDCSSGSNEGQQRRRGSGSGSASSSRSRASSICKSETYQDPQDPARRTLDQMLAKQIDPLVRDLDQASVLGERAIEDVATEVNGLIQQIHQLANDRQIWADQFLAMKDLQRLGELCSQASACA